MKVDIQEVFFIKEAMKSVSIKASDAPGVSKLIEKLDKEFVRLQKLEESKTAQ
jgi:hypothetical protein|tara:strand:+ start:1063 stop:1221 length:159 start_codon:yes stop_codon:yes gene_type:complete